MALEEGLAHLLRDKVKLLNRARRLRGQVEAIENALAEGHDSHSILHMVSACRGAINGLMGVLLEGHIRYHVVDPDRKPTSRQAGATQEVIDVLRAYLK